MALSFPRQVFTGLGRPPEAVPSYSVVRVSRFYESLQLPFGGQIA